MKPIFIIPICLAFSACNSHLYGEGNFAYDASPTTYEYTEAIDSGLLTIAPFPNRDDVCRSVDETSVPAELVKDGKMLIACPKHEMGALEDRIREGARVVAHAKHWTVLNISKPSGLKLSGYSDQLSKKIADTTIITYGDFHGTQIEYRDPQGGAWLVYPNNRSVLPGIWRLSTDQRMCHQYFSWGINPATGVVGYDWECEGRPYRHVSSQNYQIFVGDPFKLYKRKGSIPSGDLKRRVSKDEIQSLFNPD